MRGKACPMKPPSFPDRALPIRRRRPLSVVRTMLASEAAGGLILMAAAALALAVANGPFAEAYAHGLHAALGPMSVQHLSLIHI